MPLPKTITEPQVDPGRLTIALYGPPGIGKSTFAAGASNAIFLACEPGLHALKHFGWKATEDGPEGVNNWAQFQQAYRELKQPGHGYKTIIIDTGNSAFQFCRRYICDEHHVRHETDMAGSDSKGYQLINDEFHLWMRRFAALPMGLIVIFHTREKIVNKGKANESTKFVPELPDSARAKLVALCDLVLFFDLEEIKETDEQDEEVTCEGYRHVLRTKPNSQCEAKDRFGALPPILHLKSATRSYAIFLEAFKRGLVQKERGPAEGTKPVEGTRPAESAVTANAPVKTATNQATTTQVKPTANGQTKSVTDQNKPTEPPKK